MPRRIVICCDGTDNEFGTRDTNVVRLVEVLRDSPEGSQLVYYDPGIGTMPEPGIFTKIGKKLYRLLDGMVAIGLTGKVERAYTYLMNVWGPGDMVYLFGFSRGAYTVRVLAAALHQLGLLPRHSENLVPYALRLFGSVRGKGPESNYWKLCNEFRRTFARTVPNSASRHFPIEFLGVWDTVSSVGWLWEPKSYPFTAENQSIRVARQALALDERRRFFRQNQLKPTAGQDLQERWFAGVHSDIGGGYPESGGRSWRASFGWLVSEAMRFGLTVDAVAVAKLTNPGGGVPAWQEPLHESLTGAWWAGEFIPKSTYRPATNDKGMEMGLGRSRIVGIGSVLHHSALERIHGSKYAPRSLNPTFLGRIRAALPPGDEAYTP